MSDQQLLDLAAKAAMRAGLKLECPDELDGVYVSRCSGRNGYTWNPLEDDGDALRLAVKLGIKMRWHAVLNQALAWPCAGHTLELQENGEDHAGDPFAATRRAIVRAAAEIGKAMQEKH
ncbi:hypothetical protein WLF18_01180 [Pseudomonas shirazensis]|uniref:Phage ABA sandwich domain-containing protein n=1 Tax=Pseudomonas shirazensis TaxID=2745494 RepID=A0ABU8ZV82_9PSED